jgi:hypothetical protein
MELLAKAIIASAVRLRVRAVVISHRFRADYETCCPLAHEPLQRDGVAITEADKIGTIDVQVIK